MSCEREDEKIYHFIRRIDEIESGALVQCYADGKEIEEVTISFSQFTVCSNIVLLGELYLFLLFIVFLFAFLLLKMKKITSMQINLPFSL